MTKIKVCGLTRTEDIEIVNRYKPDYVGFVFAKSKRQISVEHAKELIARLSQDIKTVGVFVNMGVAYVADTAKFLGLDVIQLHGDEMTEYINCLKGKANCELWKAIRIKNGANIDDVESFPVHMILLDKYKEQSYGGSGEAFDWHGAENLNIRQNIVLAGGLNKENVLDGISIFHPYAVDVSSGVETDGVKDEAKIKEFIDIVRGNYEPD